MKKEYSEFTQNKKVYVCGYSNFEKYTVSEYNSIPVDVSIKDSHVLRKYIIEEGMYYNSIVKTISPMIRTSKEDFSIIMSKYKNLLLKVAETGFKLTPCMYKKIDLPDYMKVYEDIIYGKNKDGSRIFPIRLAFLIDSVSAPAKILSGTRINIANEIFRYTIEQIEKMNIVSDDSDEIVYKRAAEMLEIIEPIYKNSLQFTKNSISMSYDFENECTKIYIGYISDPIIVKNINLIKNSNWNILILKFNYDKNNNLNWYISTKKLKSDYMVKTSTYTRKKLR